jgi:hypothetical protein
MVLRDVLLGYFEILRHTQLQNPLGYRQLDISRSHSPAGSVREWLDIHIITPLYVATGTNGSHGLATQHGRAVYGNKRDIA